MIIDLPKERIIEAAKIATHPDDCHWYEPSISSLLEERIYEEIGYEARHAGHLIVIRDFSPQCHFAMGLGRQIAVRHKDQDKLSDAESVYHSAVESKIYDAIEDFSIDINYRPPPQDKVIQFEDGEYLKEFERGARIGFSWPHCAECGAELGGASRENTSHSMYWICPTHGEVYHAVAKDGGKVGERRGMHTVRYTDTPEEAMKVNSNLRKFIIDDLIDAGYKVR